MTLLCPRNLKVCLHRSWRAANFSQAAGHQPNPALQLDPSLQALLKDVDMSLHNYSNTLPHRELQAFPGETVSVSDHLEAPKQTAEFGRKSPAAEFGSEMIGAVVLPDQLSKSIKELIQDSNKALLHLDAKRLFLNENAADDTEHGWDVQYDVRYRSRKQGARHAERDGIAYASIALPPHYSAIVAVLHHLRRRLGPSWSIKNVLDWGAGTGSGLWASISCFQIPKPEQHSTAMEDFQLSNSTIKRYVGIDKRDGLIKMGKRLVNDIDSGNLQITWQRTLKSPNGEEIQGKDTLALSSFLLSSLPTAVSRKMLVREMWESGAEVIVLIDHKTVTGFEAIAEAREYLLKLGRKELEHQQDNNTPISSSKGSYVVAPCPHDGVCPLYHGGVSRLHCGFSQRIQRPDFVRRTKHSKQGHEDIEYSYVVIRRGTRPPIATTQAGRIGEVGLRALQMAAQAQIPIKELALDEDTEETFKTFESDAVQAPQEIQNQEDLEASLRQESFSWPRLVFPPLKRNGHVILDGCTSEGKIMRMIIPRSQGKQPYYDARKSRWGDIFPHQPKNPAQERHLIQGARERIKEKNALQRIVNSHEDYVS